MIVSVIDSLKYRYISHIDDLMAAKCNSSALAMESLPFTES